jgi:hypothetical protein
MQGKTGDDLVSAEVSAFLITYVLHLNLETCELYE